MLYYLAPLIAKEATIWVKENNKLVKRYFLWDRDDGAFLKTNKVQFVVHRGMKPAEVQHADFLDVENDMLVISTRSYQALHQHIKDDVEFHPCDVFCEDERFDFFIGKIINRRPIIDRQKSSYWNLDEDVKTLKEVVYSKSEDNFFLSRDSENGNYYAASEKLMNLIQDHNLKIKGVQLPTEPGYLFG